MADPGKDLSPGPDGHGFGGMGVFWPAASHHFPSRRASTHIAIAENASRVADRNRFAVGVQRDPWHVGDHTSGVGAITCTV
jgi:hypothetical protein